MAFAKLFFKKGNYISTVELDVIIKESATATSKLTENPVEFGANVNDHVIIEPMTFTTEGIVSNVSSSFIGQFTRVPAIFSGENTKAKEAWEALLELQANKTPFTLVQGLKEYENIMILSLSQNQDKDTSNGLFFTATMKELIFVGSEIITEEQFNEAGTSDKMVPTTYGGLKQVKEPLA